LGARGREGRVGAWTCGHVCARWQRGHVGVGALGLGCIGTGRGGVGARVVGTEGCVGAFPRAPRLQDFSCRPLAGLLFCMARKASGSAAGRSGTRAAVLRGEPAAKGADSLERAPPVKDRVPESVEQEVANIRWRATKHAWRVQVKVDGVHHKMHRATHADAVRLLRELTGVEPPAKDREQVHGQAC